MALNWYWSDVLGEIVYTDGSKKILYEGNCLAVIASVSNADEFGKPFPKPTPIVYGEFWNDKKHLEILIGLKKNWQGKKENYYADVKKIRLNSFFWDGAMGGSKTICACFVKAHIPVEVYYKEIKRKKVAE